MKASSKVGQNRKEGGVLRITIPASVAKAKEIVVGDLLVFDFDEDPTNPIEVRKA